MFKNYKKRLAILYIFLTIIKFFTANIYTVREEDPTIYFKFYPSIENTFMPIVEHGQLEDYYNHRYAWYENKQYWEIFHSAGGMQRCVEIVYDILIWSWWIISAALICYTVYKMICKRKE